MSDAAEEASKDSISLADRHVTSPSHQDPSQETPNYDIIAFEEGDKYNPYNWSNVSQTPHAIQINLTN